VVASRTTPAGSPVLEQPAAGRKKIIAGKKNGSFMACPLKRIRQ
jgi:hypothetical protein